MKPGCRCIVMVLVLGIGTPAFAQTPKVTLAPEDATIAIAPNAPQADGVLEVTFTDIAPQDVKLRAAPLRQGDAYGFVRFPDGGNHDTIRLNELKLNCKADTPCPVHFSVTELWPPGLYQGTIEALGQTSKLASTPISVVRLASTFHPVLASDAMHDGRFSVDVDGDTPTTFHLTVQNPIGLPPQHFSLATCSVSDTGGCPTAQPAVSFNPHDFWLEPGATQPVSAVVQPCPASDPCSTKLVVEGTDPKVATVQTVISVNQYHSVYRRQAWLFVVVLLGSGVSVLLNNLFPATRAKQAVRDDLRRIKEKLRCDCPNAGDALLDALGTEATRLTLVVQQIWFTDSNKDAELANVRQATATLDASAALARRLSLLRTDAEGAVLSIATRALLLSMLREAEEALRASDTDSAASRLNDAQAKLTQARNDGEQAELRRTLQNSINKLIQERGVKPAPPKDPPADAKPSMLEQRADREPIIRDLIAQLDDDTDDYTKLSTTDLLDAERDFYVADVWTEYMERKLDEFSGPAPTNGAGDWQKRKSDWIAFSQKFLQCLRRSPNSDQTQTMLDLLRHDTTLQDIATALKAGSARIECDTQPKYMEAVDVALVLKDLRDVSAVRRIMSYQWSFGDETTPPPNADRCRHYFQRPPRKLWHQPPPRSYDVSAKVSVPFTDAQDVEVPAQKVTPRPSHIVGVTRWTGWINFAVTASIAVVTAFGAKYATSVPNVIGWPDYLTAFMLGFGLDQLRDTVSSPLAAPPPPPPAAAAAAAVTRPPTGGAAAHA